MSSTFNSIYFLILLNVLSGNGVAAFINSGTPSGVPPSFDCAVREYAYSYGMSMQPRHGSFLHLFDALQLSACNVTRPKSSTMNEKRKLGSKYINNNNNINADDCTFYIDANKGNDNNDGSINNPFQTIEKGVETTRSTRTTSTQNCILYLRNSTFYLTQPIQLTSNDSYLTITNYKQEFVIISGGLPLKYDSSQWKLVEFEPLEWKIYNNSNNCYGRSNVNQSTDNVLWLGVATTLQECIDMVQNAQSNQAKFGAINGFCYNDVSISQKSYAGQCYGIHDVSFQPMSQSGIYSGRYMGKNIWSIQISNNDEINDNNIYGLRINNKRGIRARYPDQITEIGMQFDAISGWIPTSYGTKWKPPNKYPAPENIIYTAKDYVNDNVEWPMVIPGFNTTNQYTGMGNWGEYHIGYGGTCNKPGIEPNYGYWCSSNSPRGTQYQHVSPSGLYLNPSFLPNYPYLNVSGAVIHTWRPAHWFTMMFDVDSNSDYDASTKLLNFSYGGFQGGEGTNSGAEWYIENVFEELTMANEYFYNKSTNTLYFFYNSSDATTKAQPPPSDIELIATNTKILFNISGTMDNPIKNITFNGIEYRDTRYTYLDPHGMPTGGDWGLQRQGAFTITGGEYILINSSLFTRLDGNGIFINGYNRNITISNNDFEWIGDSVITLWGDTSTPDNNNKILNQGPDGRNGKQPRFIHIYNNLAREIGLFQKQSSLYFQATSCQNIIENNIFFNGPRAAINFNDGFGGGNILRYNLLINAVRESGDHGPFNSWDRIPYVTNVNTGKPSIIPKYNQIYQNFVIGTYQTQEAIDNDDGSAHYLTYKNFFVYGNNGMKNDFDGNNNNHYENIYAYNTGTYGFMSDTGAYDRFTNNTVIFRNGGSYPSTCIKVPGFIAYGNHLYNKNGAINCCGTTLQNWTKQGNDPGTTISTLPSDQTIIQWAKGILPY